MTDWLTGNKVDTSLKTIAFFSSSCGVSLFPHNSTVIDLPPPPALFKGTGGGLLFVWGFKRIISCTGFRLFFLLCCALNSSCTEQGAAQFALHLLACFPYGF